MLPLFNLLPYPHHPRLVPRKNQKYQDPHPCTPHHHHHLGPRAGVGGCTTEAVKQHQREASAQIYAQRYFVLSPILCSAPFCAQPPHATLPHCPAWVRGYQGAGEHPAAACAGMCMPASRCSLPPLLLFFFFFPLSRLKKAKLVPLSYRSIVRALLKPGRGGRRDRLISWTL